VRERWVSNEAIFSCEKCDYDLCEDCVRAVAPPRRRGASNPPLCAAFPVRRASALVGATRVHPATAPPWRPSEPSRDAPAGKKGGKQGSVEGEEESEKESEEESEEEAEDTHSEDTHSVIPTAPGCMISTFRHAPMSSCRPVPSW